MRKIAIGMLMVGLIVAGMSSGYMIGYKIGYQQGNSMGYDRGVEDGAYETLCDLCYIGALDDGTWDYPTQGSNCYELCEAMGIEPKEGSCSTIYGGNA